MPQSDDAGEGGCGLSDIAGGSCHLDSAKIWSWPIFRPGFSGEHLWAIAMVQAWTLKPARLERLPRGSGTYIVARKTDKQLAFGCSAWAFKLIRIT